MVSHGHLDHAGGAKFLQERFGARLLMSAADYDLLDRDNPSWKPKRDMVVTDGQQLTLGDTTLTLLHHARPHRRHHLHDLPGARRRAAATWWPSGAARSSTSGPSARGCRPTRHSAERFRDIAAKAGADVILSNHTVYDGSKTKLPAVQARKPGQPHPYVVGPDVVQRYLTTVGECAQAAVAGLPAN